MDFKHVGEWFVKWKRVFTEKRVQCVLFILYVRGY